MATHNDATGYLLAYRDTVNEVWFHAICDHAIQSNGSHSLTRISKSSGTTFSEPKRSALWLPHLLSWLYLPRPPRRLTT